MRKLIFFFLIFFPAFGNAQPNLPKNVADSLWKIWKDESLPDTLRLKAMDEYIWKGYISTKPDSAFVYSQLMFEFATLKGLKKNISTALYLQAISMHNQGSYQDAIEYLTRSLTVRKEIGFISGIETLYGALGNSYRANGEYLKAIEFNNESLKIREELGDKKGVARTLSQIGNIYEILGEYSKTIEYNELALAIRKDLGDKKGIATNLNNVGNIYYQQGDYIKAIELYTKSKAIYEEINYKLGIAASFNNIGSIYYYNLEDLPLALDYFKKSLALFEEIGEKKGIGMNLNNIGVVFKNQSDFNSAIEYFTKSLNIEKEIGNKLGEVTALTNIGFLYLDQVKLAVKIDEAYRLKNLYEKIIESFSKALSISEEIGDKRGMSVALYGLALNYYHQQDFQKSLHTCLKALNISKEIGAGNDTRDAAKTLLILYNILDSTDKAALTGDLIHSLIMKDLEANFSPLSEKEKEKNFATMRDNFDLLYDFALNNASLPIQTERAYNNTLLTKGLLLKSSTAMRNAIYSSGDSLLTKQYDNWIALKRRIAKAYADGKNITEMEKEANETEQLLIKGSIEFSEMKKVQSLTWKQVQAHLQKGECAVEFIRFSHQEDYRIDSNKVQLYAALVINKNSDRPIIVRLFEESVLEKILGVYPGNNLSYIEQLYGTKKNPRSVLYDLIWEPLERELMGANKVYISPVGLLHKISFAALAKEKNIFLSDQYEIEILSSTGKIAMPDAVNFVQTPVYSIFGGINYNTDSTNQQIWPYLEGTMTEVENLHNVLYKETVNYYTAKNASEAAFKDIAPKSTIIHVATHGFFYPDPDIAKKVEDTTTVTKEIVFRGGSDGFGVETFVNSRNPLMRSGLAMSGANEVWSRKNSVGEDGVLTAAEVANIDLRKTELVVLSACETGLGDIKGSEGVYGLQRAFKMAGADQLIMSLWQVPDKETAEFMNTFYKHLIRSKDIHSSFSKTQKAMHSKYDPYFWAAFVLVE